MNTLSFESLSAYWSVNEVSTDVVVFLNIFGALLLGLVVGYERSFHGRAAGMRTYGLVCMASFRCTGCRHRVSKLLVRRPLSRSEGHVKPR
jgi:putative Mg2+ transporter-C (MgtC) family protein